MYYIQRNCLYIVRSPGRDIELLSYHFLSCSELVSHYHSILFYSILFYSILFCTFIALNLCKADSKAQHQKSSLRNHLSIAVAKSSTTETPDRVYAKEGTPCGRDMILTFS